MLNIVLFGTGLLVLALIFFLSREMRLRRALQLLIAKLLSNWRSQNSDE